MGMKKEYIMKVFGKTLEKRGFLPFTKTEAIDAIFKLHEDESYEKNNTITSDEEYVLNLQQER